MNESEQRPEGEQPPNESWKKQFTTVTPFSKLLAAVLFVTLPVLGFYMGLTYGQESVQLSDNTVSRSYQKDTKTQKIAKLRYRTETEHIAVDVRPFSDKMLHFEIQSTRRSNDDNLFFEHIQFDPDSGILFLEYGEPYVDIKLLRLHQAPEWANLERFLEDLVLQERYSGTEKEADQSIYAGLLSYVPEDDLNMFGFRSLCNIEELPKENDFLAGSSTVYRLAITDERVSAIDVLFPCGYSFSVTDDLLIENFVEWNGGDAHAPRIDSDTVHLSQDL